jgi:hypothetical protein
VIGSLTRQQGASSRIAFAAFMDRGAKFELQSYYWARSLIDSGTAERASDIHLFVPRSLETAPEWAVRAGITLVPIAYWDARHPYCNKIGIWRQDLFASYSYVCYTDCDLIFVSRPDLPVTDTMAAAIVDHENPRWPRLAQVFTKAGIAIPDPVPVRWPVNHNQVTAPNNCNGGFYLVNQRLIGPLGTAWARWARWLLDNPAVGSPLGDHVDQVALSLALTEMRVGVTPLPRTINVPTHLGKLPGTFPTAPTVLHYHSHLSKQGHLLTTGTAAVDDTIAKANRMIEHWRLDASAPHNGDPANSCTPASPQRI